MTDGRSKYQDVLLHPHGTIGVKVFLPDGRCVTVFQSGRVTVAEAHMTSLIGITVFEGDNE